MIVFGEGTVLNVASRCYVPLGSHTQPDPKMTGLKSKEPKAVYLQQEMLFLWPLNTADVLCLPSALIGGTSLPATNPGRYLVVQTF